MRKMNLRHAVPGVVCALLLVMVPLQRTWSDEPAGHGRSFAQALDATLVTATASASPGVVAIEVKRKTPEPGPKPPTVPGRPGPRPFIHGTGPVAGVILTPDGYIVTSLFNVEGDLESVKVTLPDGSQKDAKLLGQDRSRNIALLKVEAVGLPVLKIVPAGEIRVGQWVLALGRSFPGENANVSFGIVSATNRVAGRAVQTDASVGPENYGGALVDVEGRLLGILTPVGYSGRVGEAVEVYDSGIGFAIPVTDILAELERLKAGEVIRPAFLGIEFNNAKMMGGAVVEKVLPDSGAAKSGLQPKDVIIEFDGRPIDTPVQLLHAIGSRSVGDVVKFKVKRGQESLEFTVTLGPRPEELS